jgi:hypothetical protein
MLGKPLVFACAAAAILTAFIAEPAFANPSLSFTVTQSSALPPATVTVTDTSGNPDGYPLTYEWQTSYQSGPITPDLKAGSPDCLNATCSRASWTYSSPGTYFIIEQVSWPTGSGYVWDSAIVKSPPEELPGEITLVGPIERTLPTDFELTSPKMHMVIPRAFGCYTEVAANPCEPYFLGRTGPDAGGLYRYSWRLPATVPGQVTLDVMAWNTTPANGDHRDLTFTATSSGIAFGDFQTCLTQHLRARGGGLAAFELSYVSRETSTALIFQKERVGRRWLPVKLKALKELPVGPSARLAPFTRRTVRVRVKENDVSRGRLRLFYIVMHGAHKGPMTNVSGKLTRFSTQPCLPPGGG